MFILTVLLYGSVVLSDGAQYITSVLGGQLNSLIQADKLKKYTIVKITDFVTNNVKGKKYVVNTNNILSKLNSLNLKFLHFFF